MRILKLNITPFTASANPKNASIKLKKSSRNEQPIKEIANNNNDIERYKQEQIRKQQEWEALINRPQTFEKGSK